MTGGEGRTDYNNSEERNKQNNEVVNTNTPKAKGTIYFDQQFVR